MQCSTHISTNSTHKCQTCHKYLCPQCSTLHQLKSHNILTAVQLSQLVLSTISEQINRMNLRIMELGTMRDYQNGQAVVLNCMHQIIQFVKKVFEDIRLAYRKVCDASWKLQNTQTIAQLQHKRNVLQMWRDTIRKKSDQVLKFDSEQIYENNRLDSDEDQMDSTSSYMQGQSYPKIVFNQLALRRSYQNLSKTIFTTINTSRNSSSITTGRRAKLLNTSRSTTAINNNYISLCKFVQGTNVLYQYVINDPDETEHPRLTRIQFREFVAPYRSSCVMLVGQVYLIGGLKINKDNNDSRSKDKIKQKQSQKQSQNKAKKQIYYYDRSLHTMRVIGLLKQARVAHAVTAFDQNIYIFGGKGCKTLQVFNIRSKVSSILAEHKSVILGSSMVYLYGKLYIFGGTDGIQHIPYILRYSIIQRQLQCLHPPNIQLYMLPICPIVHPISQQQILILGGYFQLSGQSYNNCQPILYNSRTNSLSIYSASNLSNNGNGNGNGNSSSSKGTNKFGVTGCYQVIYPLIANGNNTIVIGNKLIAVADLKRRRDKHGPNLPVLFTFDLTDEIMQIDILASV